jgi:glycosyltransferase involved in cell wall biosynthesis
MRVAVITTSYPVSADDPSGHFVQTEARLLAQDAEVIVIAAGGRSTPGLPAMDDRGVTIWRLDGGDAFGWPGVAARLRERPGRALAAARWLQRARSLLRKLSPFDRIVAHWAVPSAFPVARSLGTPLEVVSHGGDVRLLTRVPAAVRHTIMDCLLRDVSSWRFVSQPLHDRLAVTLHRDLRHRLSAVARISPAAIDLPDVSVQASVLRSHRDGRRLMVCVGRLVEGKRFDRALDHVARKARASTRVVVVGDGPDRPRLEARARALGVDAHFVGRTSREVALAWIAAADGLIHASRDEGLSTVVREAEALGVPVEVVSD